MNLRFLLLFAFLFGVESIYFTILLDRFDATLDPLVVKELGRAIIWSFVINCVVIIVIALWKKWQVHNPNSIVNRG